MNCDYAQGGSMIEWPKTLDAVMKLDIDTVIPNRGNPATKADLQAARDRIAKIDSVAIDLVKKGTPKDQLLAQINAADSTLNVNGFLEHQRAAAAGRLLRRIAEAGPISHGFNGFDIR